MQPDIPGSSGGDTQRDQTNPDNNKQEDPDPHPQTFSFDLEIVWLVGTFVELVWKEKMQQKRKIGIEKAIGHMKQKFKENQFSRKPSFGFIRYVTN